MNKKAVITLIVLLCLVSGWFLFFPNWVPQLTPLKDDAVILAFGDSLTFGTGTTKDHSYPAALAKLCGHKVINEGIPGELSSAGVKRLPDLLDEHQPALLILCHGGNDILQLKEYTSCSSKREPSGSFFDRLREVFAYRTVHNKELRAEQQKPIKVYYGESRADVKRKKRILEGHRETIEYA